MHWCTSALMCTLCTNNSALTSVHGGCQNVINPRRACARVMWSVCLSVYPSVPALAASASVANNGTHGFLLGVSMCGVSKKPSVQKLWRGKANELELTVSRFRAVSGPTKRSSYVKGNWWVE